MDANDRSGRPLDAGIEAWVHRWLDAWNARDLERILTLFSDDVVFTSPLVARLMGDPSATVRGKDALRAYWSRGLAASPALHFELEGVYPGHDTVVIAFRNERGRRSADVLQLGPDGRAVRGWAHHMG